MSIVVSPVRTFVSRGAQVLLKEARVDRPMSLRPGRWLPAGAWCAAVLLTGTALAAPAGYLSSQIAGAQGGTAALTFGPDGTLYLADMSRSNAIRAVAPSGAARDISISGASLASVGGMAWDPVSSRVLVTDNKGWGDGQGYLYSIDPATGAAEVLAFGIDYIDDVAVSPAGHIFISDANWAPSGRIMYVPRSGAPLTVVDNLNLAAGLGFDAGGNLFFQDLDFSFLGNVWRATVSDGPTGPLVGAPQLLASGLSAAFDLTVDSEGDVFVSGSGGLMMLDRGPGGAFTGMASIFDSNGNPWQFATEVAFIAGPDPFEPFGGARGGRLVYVPEYGSSSLISITTAVPEPTAIAAGLALASLLAIRRRRSEL